MTPRETEMLEVWQASCEGAAERRLRDLTDVVDDLTTLTHSRQGARIVKASRTDLVAALKKLHDLVIETEPTPIAQFVEKLRSRAS